MKETAAMHWLLLSGLSENINELQEKAGTLPPTRLNRLILCHSNLHNTHTPTCFAPPPPPILHNLCFLFLLGIAVQPKEIEDNASANDWGVKKMCYGRCAMLKWEKLERLSHWKGYGWSTGIYFFSLKSDELLNENKWHCTIIRCKFFFLFICQEPITWPANNC